jgi:membrane dipeptidase
LDPYRDLCSNVGVPGRSPTDVHHDAFVVDCHNDLPVELFVREFALGELGDPEGFYDRWTDEFRAGGVDLQVLPVFIDPSVGEAALRLTLSTLARLRRAIGARPAHLRLCLTASDLDAVERTGQVGALLALEGCTQVGANLELLEPLHALGVRMASLTHFGRNVLADGSADEDVAGPLPSRGVEAVRELDRLGIVFDVSHLAARAVDHALTVATRPVVASHSCARAIHDHHRNLSDEHLAGIAATGGVACVTTIPAFVDPAAPTLDRVVDHIEHMVAVAGVDHVGFGSDFIKPYFDEVYPQYPSFPLAGIDAKACIEGLERTRDLPALTQRLLERGFNPADTAAIMGGNIVRVLRDVMGKPHYQQGGGS